MKTISSLLDQQKHEIRSFFEKIYNCPMKSGGVIMDNARFERRYLARSTTSMIRQAEIYIRNTQQAFASLNIFKPNANGYYRRTEQYLWRFNHIVIDIDYMGDFVFDYDMLEEELERKIRWFSISNGIPLPNCIVFTGSGGCHLYYLFEDLPNGREKKMASGIQAVKMKLAARWVETEKYLDSVGAGYQVDLTATDASRMLRVPGSIHERTGRMCRMKMFEVPRYGYKALCKLLDEKKWNGTYAIMNAYRDIEHSRHGYGNTSRNLFKRFIGDNMTAHCLGIKRLNELFALARQGWGFVGCREKTAHLVWIWSRDAGLSQQETEYRLHELNRLFYSPLSERELLYTARGSGKQYKYTNKRIRMELGLDGTEGFFLGRRSHAGKDRAKTTAVHKKKIAELVLAGKKILEIARELRLSISLVKRRRSEMKKAEGFSFWAAILV